MQSDIETLAAEGYPVRAVQRTDGIEYVVDLGNGAPEAAVDVADGTVIVVAGDDQFEIAVPGGDAEAFIRNGVLTIYQEEA